MIDYKKYDIPSPDGYYAPVIECRACDSNIMTEEMNVKELLEGIEAHERECIPKTWIYSVGYERAGFDNSIHIIWHVEKVVTDSEKAEYEEKAKGFAKGVHVKFKPRHW